MVVSTERFVELVSEALEDIPEDLAKAMENVVVIVEESAGGRPLYGLYEGVPLTKRGPTTYYGVMPDRISIFKDTISSRCHDEAELKRQVRKTVIHEVAHHFGINDERLTELGWS